MFVVAGSSEMSVPRFSRMRIFLVDSPPLFGHYVKKACGFLSVYILDGRSFTNPFPERTQL